MYLHEIILFNIAHFKIHPYERTLFFTFQFVAEPPKIKCHSKPLPRSDFLFHHTDMTFQRLCICEQNISTRRSVLSTNRI